MSAFPEGRALVYCEGAFGTPNGKTAHGLVRRTRRYDVLAVIDTLNGADQLEPWNNVLCSGGGCPTAAP